MSSLELSKVVLFEFRFMHLFSVVFSFVMTRKNEYLGRSLIKQTNQHRARLFS